MALTTGSRLGPYEIVSAIGAGGMGEVYKAKDTRLDRIVALKVLAVSLASDAQFRERFEREARSISALNHPNVCTLHDVGSQDGVSFLVMECLEGETLAARLARGALPLADALRIATEIASALDKAHHQGIIHRDLKPGNVMLTKSGAKLLDFGLAKVGPGAFSGVLATALPTAAAPLTAQGAILGTFQYMAPEQLEGAEADARTDIFSFGALLYEMLTGKRAFEGKTQASLIAAILDRDPPPVSTVQPLTPVSLDRLVKKCLAKDPDERWQSAKDLGDELKWIAGTSAASDTERAPVMRRGRRERLAWVVAAVALVLSVGVVTYAAINLRRPESEAALVRFEIATLPTSDPFVAVSPDGRLLVYPAKGDRGPQLWLRPLDQLTAQPLPGTEGGSYPFWSPDSRAIGFFANGKLKRVDVAGGLPIDLASAPAARGGAWSQGGVMLFAPATQSALYQIAATGGTPQQVTQTGTESGGTHRWPQFLPDGRHFLFYAYQGPTEVRGVYMGSLDGSPPVHVMVAEGAAVFVPPDRLLVPRQGVLSVWRFDPQRGAVVGEPMPVANGIGETGVGRAPFAASATGALVYRAGGGQKRQLTWIDRSGRTLGMVGAPDGYWLSSPEISPNGQQVAVHREVKGDNDVWLIEIGRGVASRFTFDPANDTTPVWSPDGTRIFFVSGRSGILDLFEKPSSGATEEQPLLTSKSNKWPQSVSPDGHFLLYRVLDPKMSVDLWALPLTGDRTPVPAVQAPFEQSEGQFSPDGRWLAYASNESGGFEIYIRPFPGASGKWQVSVGGGTQVRWRPDGKELFYVAPDERLMAVPILAHPDSHTPDVGTPVPLFQTRLATGSNVTGTKPQYAVARDGRFLMNVAIEEAVAPPITVVLNWQATLKK